MYKQLFILFTCMLFSFSAIAQVTIKGTVTSAEDGMGLPGVSVLQKGTTNGVATDIDGNYTLTVPDNSSIIIFSSIGMQTIEIPASQAGDLVMQVDNNVLDEVVVTALGIKREAKKLGYAMTEIKGDKLAGKNTVNAVSALQGESAGVSIGSSDGGLFGNAKIQIRGISTLNSKNNQPIFVVDGVILENSVSDKSADWNSNANDFGNILKNLNPDDFKTVSVLKGAAATALYGSRGINGVVLIETKDGKGSKGLGVSVKHSVGIDHVYKAPKIQKEFGSGAFAGYINYGKKKADGKNYYKFDTNQFYTNADGKPSVAGFGWGWLGYGPKFDGREVIGFDKEKMSYSPQKNNVIDVYDLGINNNTSVSLKGGNEKGSFYLSDSYNHRTGTLPNNSFERNALLFSGNFELAKWLRAEASISFTTSTSKNPQSDISANFINGAIPNYYNTNKYKNRKYWQAPHGGIPANKYGDKYVDVPSKNLWFRLNMNNRIRKEQVTRPVVRLTADIIENLSATLEGNMNYYTSKYEEKSWGEGYANEGGYYQLYNNVDESKTGKLIFNYNKELFEELTGNFVLGGEIWKQEKAETKIETDGGLVVPGKFYLENSKKTKKSNGKVYDTKQINSAYFLASFAYQEKLFLDITGRNDWSSSLVYTNGEGNNSYFYPSVSSSWIFSQSLNLPEWFTFGKIRASWAQVGSDTEPYLINKGYQLKSHETSKGNYVYTNGVSTVLVDRSIKPERKNSFEVGTDLRFFNNRLNFDIAYYDETVTEQIGSIPLPDESGYEEMLTNIGSLTNRGIELSITGKPIQTEDFEWISTFNYWDNTTKIKELHKDYGEYKTLGGNITYGNFRIGSVAFEGGEYGVLMSDSKPATWQSKDAKGNNIDDPRNGMKLLSWINEKRGARYTRSNKVERVGKIQPDFEGSWKNSFSYKGISLSLLLDARFGGTMVSYSNRYGTANGWLQASLYGRNPEHGGVSWTSKYKDSKGEKFSDGIIMEGVFAKGQKATSPAGKKVDLGGLTYKQAVDKGYIEPTHASYYHFFRNSWGTGVVNDDWVSEVNYVALRDISIGYNFPKRIAEKVGMQNLYVALNAHNVGYLYNSLPNNLNPESFRGTTSSESFRERSFTPYTRTYTFTLKMDF